MQSTEHKSFGSPEEVREFPHGRAEIIKVGDSELGRLVLQPGWRWSNDVKPIAKTESCEAPHFQYHVSGRLAIRIVSLDGTGEDLKVLLAGRSYGSLVDGLLTAAGRLVEPAKELADYVIFDTPPVTDVSDILPLSQYVDDVLIVSRLGHSRVDKLVNLGEVLSRQGVSPTGLVIVDDDLNQGSGYYYAQAPHSRGRGPLGLGGRARAARS